MWHRGAQTQAPGFHLGKSTWPRMSAEFCHLELKLLLLWKRTRVQRRATENQTFPSAVGRARRRLMWGMVPSGLVPARTLVSSSEAVWPLLGQTGGGVTDTFSHCLLCGYLDLSMCGQAKQLQKVCPQSLLTASIRNVLGKYGATSFSSAHLWLCVHRARHFSLSLASHSCLPL